MSSSTAIHYAHEEIDRYFSEAFTTFSELRKSNVMTDIILTTSNDLAIHNVVEYESDTTKMESFKDKNKTLVTINYLIMKILYILSKIIIRISKMT